MDRHFGNLQSIIFKYLLTGKEMNGELTDLFAALAPTKNTTIYKLLLNREQQPTSFLEIPNNTELLSCEIRDGILFGRKATNWGDYKEYKFGSVKKTSKRKREENITQSESGTIFICTHTLCTTHCLIN